jgi:Short C-terminal domain
MMRQLTPEGQRAVEDIARRHGFSTDATLAMLNAMVEGGGTMAQFGHPEFGGMGQWSQGGMLMIGDMFNNQLKGRVDALCTELSSLLAGQAGLWRTSGTPSQSQRQSQGGQSGGAGGVSLFVAGGGFSGGWWPEDLGSPASAGAQNNIRYAWFPATRRLAIQIDGRTMIYDTGDHRITGVSQQQSGDASLTFTSQHGLVRVTELPVVSPVAAVPHAEPSAKERPPARATEPAVSTPPPARAEPTGSPPPPVSSEPAPVTPPASADDIFAKLERLAQLREKGILSEEEFAAKKAELLSRL